jgi:cytochrome c-type biogenesis protein CcmH
MGQWLLFAALTAAAAGFIVWPFLRAKKATESRAALDIAVYRDQLRELARDRDHGLLSDTEAAAAEAEIGRRMLKASGGLAETVGHAIPAADTDRPVRPYLAILIAFAAVSLALLIYLAIGQPGMPDQPLRARQSELAKHAEADSIPAIEARAAALAQRVASDPRDVEGWVLLARVRTALGLHAESAEAYRQAHALKPDSPEIASALAESLVFASNGVVTPEAQSLFERVHTLVPLEPRARYYLALAAAQAGRPQEALDQWTALARDSRADAPWMQAVAARIEETARALGIDPPTVLPAPRADETADPDAVAKLPPAEREAKIRSMVERLAARLEAQPNDLDGWLMLGRSYRTLGEGVKAAAAYSRAATLAPKDVKVLLAYGESLLALKAPDDRLPKAFIGVMNEIRNLEPDNPVALYFLGIAEVEAGNRDAAAALWRRVLDRMPPDAPERRELERRIDDLTKKKGS